MAVAYSEYPSFHPPNKRRRRTATSVCAGDNDPRPRRDVLTSLLNGVSANPEAEMRGIENGRRGSVSQPQPAPVPAEKAPPPAKKRGRPPKVRAAPVSVAQSPAMPTAPITSYASISAPAPIRPPPAPLSPLPAIAVLPALDPAVFGTRPHVHLPQDHRSRSFSPPNMGPPSPPGPSISSSTTRTSSKRPHTPDDGFLDPAYHDGSSTTPEPSADQSVSRPPRKKRNTATKKGWKGWVEISEDEEEVSAKLISSEAPLILSSERRTRSGRVV